MQVILEMQEKYISNKEDEFEELVDSNYNETQTDMTIEEYIQDWDIPGEIVDIEVQKGITIGATVVDEQEIDGQICKTVTTIAYAKS